jgi:hypothetical protein
MGISERISKWWRGLRDEEWQALSALRSLAQLLSTAPELAQRLLDLLPAIVTEIKRLERALPERGRGRERLAELVAWVEVEHGDGLQRVAQLGEIVTAVRALAGLLVAFLNATGMFRK